MTASRQFSNHRCRLPRQAAGAQGPTSLPARQKARPPPDSPPRWKTPLPGHV